MGTLYRWFLGFLPFILVVVCLASIALPVSASEQEYIYGWTEAEQEVPLAEFPLESSEDLVPSDKSKSLIGVFPQSVVGPVDENDTSGLKAIMLSLLGPYDPIVCEYAYTNTQGYVSYVREIEPDYIWMISAAIFLVVLFCLFRLIGGLIKRV